MPHHARPAHSGPSIHVLLARARDVAYRRSISFCITAEDVLVPERCPIKPSIVLSGGGFGRQGLIERLDLNRPYVPGNITVISRAGLDIRKQRNAAQVLQDLRTPYPPNTVNVTALLGHTISRFHDRCLWDLLTGRPPRDPMPSFHELDALGIAGWKRYLDDLVPDA